MASSSGTSSESTQLQNSGSEEDLQLLMNQRKQKRMLSNRESARRSRMRKQKHLDELMAQVAQLRKENGQILTNLHITTQQYLNIESENSVLRAQMGELGHRLQSLNEIINYLDANNGMETEVDTMMINDTFMTPWNNNSMYMNQQPIMASADIFHQY
ncbi:hypothetical protein AQUCO_01000561v1 [Aquilegia coerulea]|uniref:BZIP domain-containing protein n=1 Tax=Aquilegia coerulea TaxID=218851 RepID=A0A2G5EAK7_AQUCA|nr:hypothetical protein AQUCO_01000561v1 [Aquilegia coerulea]